MKKLKEKSIIKKCAQNVATCANIKKGECVLLKGNTYAQEFLEEIALIIYEKGGLPQITRSSDDFRNAMFQNEKIKAETLEIPPKTFDCFDKKI